MQFIDTHCHLHLLLLKSKLELAKIIENAQQNNITKFITLATNINDFEISKQMTIGFENTIYYGVGIHPWYISSNITKELMQLEQFLQANIDTCIMLGEIGLDKKINNEIIDQQQLQIQIEVLETQLTLAKKFNLPVSLHSRRTHAELYKLLSQFKGNISGVIHAFSGSYEQAKLFIELGFKIGVGSVITNPDAKKTIKTISKLPLESLVLETDSPDMLPYQSTDLFNQPKNLTLIFNYLCQIRNEEPSKIAEQLWENSIIYTKNLSS